MAISINTDKEVAKKQLKILGIVLLSPIVLIILGIVVYFAMTPVFDNIEHDKFKTLDNNMQELYHQLQTVSGGAEEWKYQAVCSAEYDSWRSTGNYYCVTLVSTKKDVYSLQELNSLQEKYFPAIDSSEFWKVQSDGGLHSLGDFGEKFNVSLTSKNYYEKSNNILCRYGTFLEQLSKNTDYSKGDDQEGSAIKGGQANFIIRIECEDTATKPWYTEVKRNTDLVP